MILRIHFPSMARAGAPAAAFAKTLTAALAPLFRRRLKPISLPGSAILSDHQLRDIGVKPGLRGCPDGFALTDLVPRSTVFSHRHRR